jgi:hypothetical protein
MGRQRRFPFGEAPPVVFISLGLRGLLLAGDFNIWKKCELSCDCQAGMILRRNSSSAVRKLYRQEPSACRWHQAGELEIWQAWIVLWSFSYRKLKSIGSNSL